MSPGQFRILVIEDTPSDVKLIQSALDQVGVSYHLTIISDGEAALAFVHRKEALRPDIVLLDLSLPKVDGVEVLRAIRSSEHLRDVAVLIVSGSRAPAARHSIEELGAEMFWTKPITLDGFLDLAEIVKAVAEGFVKENGKTSGRSTPA